MKGGEPDVDGVAKMVLNDFLRGKIPWFTPPPKRVGAETAETEAATEVVEGREGRLGEMPGKRKATTEEPGQEVDQADQSDTDSSAEEDEDEATSADDNEGATLDDEDEDEDEETSEPEQGDDGGAHL